MMKKNLLIGIIASIAIGVFIFFGKSNYSASVLNANTTKEVLPTRIVVTQQPIISPTLTPSPTIKIVITSSHPPQPTVISTPASYANYGWYIHDGQSMQYVNGSWFIEPQQNATPTPTPTPPYACPSGKDDGECQFCKQNNYPSNDCHFRWLQFLRR